MHQHDGMLPVDALPMDALPVDALPVDYRDLSPEEMEEIRNFEMLVRDVMNDKLAMA